MIMMSIYGYYGYMGANLLWCFMHIDVENMLTDLLYGEKLQEAGVRQEHKGLK